jgi:hypothetical protein
MESEPLHTRVEKSIQTNQGDIVLEDPHGFPRNESNLYYINRDEEIIWRAEKPAADTLYSRVRLNEDGESLSAYTTGGHACELDLRTGKLLSQSRIQ